LENQILDVVRRCVLLLPGVFHIQSCQVSRRQGHHQKKKGLWYTVAKKLLMIGGYVNKGYHVFINSYFMSVPLVCHLH
jgi:hypothetical protein